MLHSPCLDGAFGARTMRRVSPNPIGAVIPAHDEAPRIGPVVTAASRHVPILVVDDGSTDGTEALATAAGALVLRQEPNQGKGAALRAGFRRALEDGWSAAITLDADGQHDPDEIPRFTERWAEGGAELLVGRRNFRSMPTVRRLSNSLGTVVLRTLVGQSIPDNQSGYRLVGRRLMEAMLESDEDGFAFEVEMIAVCLREEWPIAWVPIRTIYGDERSHIRPLHHLREFLAVAWRARTISRQPPRWRSREPATPGASAPRG
jgi:glycosyltransferase involved in cell wall biosynthesis